MYAAPETLSKGWESSKKAMEVGRDLMAIAGFDNSQLLQATMYQEWYTTAIP